MDGQIILHTCTASLSRKINNLMYLHSSTTGVSNLLFVAGQIFACKFTSGHNHCSNQSDVLMLDFLLQNQCSLKKNKKGLHLESGSDLQFSSPNAGVL